MARSLDSTSKAVFHPAHLTLQRGLSSLQKADSFLDCSLSCSSFQVVELNFVVFMPNAGVKLGVGFIARCLENACEVKCELVQDSCKLGSENIKLGASTSSHSEPIKTSYSHLPAHLAPQACEEINLSA